MTNGVSSDSLFFNTKTQGSTGLNKQNEEVNDNFFLNNALITAKQFTGANQLADNGQYQNLLGIELGSAKPEKAEKKETKKAEKAEKTEEKENNEPKTPREKAIDLMLKVYDKYDKDGNGLDKAEIEKIKKDLAGNDPELAKALDEIGDNVGGLMWVDVSSSLGAAMGLSVAENGSMKIGETRDIKIGLTKDLLTKLKTITKENPDASMEDIADACKPQRPTFVARDYSIVPHDPNYKPDMKDYWENFK